MATPMEYAVRHRRHRRAGAAYGFWLLILCAALATPVWAGESSAAPLRLLWGFDSSASAAELRRETSDGLRELVTPEEAVALALEANRLVKNPERLRFITESVKQAYRGVLDSHRVLAMREEQLKACREVEQVFAELAQAGKASPSDVLQARTALAKATQEALGARQKFVAQTTQLNHLMGRDSRARLRVGPEIGPAPAAALRAGAATSGD